MFITAKYRKQPNIHRCSCIYTAVLVFIFNKKKNQDTLEAGVGRDLWFKASIVYSESSRPV